MKFALLVFLDIAQDCSLGQCLPSNRGENSQAQIKAKMIFTVLILQSVQSNLPILSCTESHHPSCWFERRPQSEVFNWVFLGLASTKNLDFCLNIDVCKYSVNSEVVAQRWSVKKLFLEILQNSQENTCTSVFFNKVANLSLQLY